MRVGGDRDNDLKCAIHKFQRWTKWDWENLCKMNFEIRENAKKGLRMNLHRFLFLGGLGILFSS